MTYVLVGVDGSDTSLRAVDWAAQHAQRRGTALQIRSCYTVPFYGEPGAFASYAVESQVDALKLEHEEIVSTALGRARAMGVEAHGDVVFAAAAGNLVEDPQASTVVVGASGRTGPIAGVLGSVTTAVAHRAEVPVVVVPAMWEGEAMKKIVVGLDGSATSDAALRWAVEEARLGGAELVAVHVWSYPYSGGPREAMRQDAQQQLDESLAAADAGKVTAKLIEGHVAGALIDESADADLLVVGSHGRGGFTSMLLGSVSRTAVQHAKCPVAVIRRQK